MNINLNDFVKKLYQNYEKNDILIDNGISYFLDFYKLNKRISTYSFYKTKLKLINNYFKENEIIYFSQLNNEIILNYILYLKSINNNNTTINKNIGVIKTLVSFLHKHEIISPITFNIDKLKESKPKINILDNASIKLIVAYISQLRSQQQLIFYLFAATGIRRTELINIKRKNIDLLNNSIYLEHTKNGHTRFIYFSDYIKELLNKELEKNKKSVYLFVENDGSQLSVFKIDHLFKKIKKNLNLEKFSPHILRHTFATYLLNNSNLETVRLLLGHENYEMTKRYLHVNNNKLKNDSISFNPLSQL